jgi:site-specific DNA recombinase
VTNIERKCKVIHGELAKIGIYVRESRDDNEQNYETIETQRGLLTDFIESRNLGSIVRIYIDDNVSGAGFERKGIEQLKSDVSKGIINLLVIKDLSRLGRNNAKTLLFLDYLEENGVRVITYDGRYDSLKDNDTVGIDTWYNERYIKDISRKIRANIRFKIQKGEYIGNSPFGYLKSPNEKNKLVINPDEAKVVKEIYRLYQEDWGYSHIARYLNQKGYPSPSNGKWNPVGVRRILCNRVYIGDTVQGISERISFKSKKTRRLPEERWVITENTHEAIIGKEEFYQVQKMMSEKRVDSGPHKGVIHLFRGIVYCGRCGSVMFSRIRKDRPMAYICSNYGKNGRSECTSHHVKEEVLAAIVVEDIVKLIDNISVDSKLKQRIEKLFSNDDSKIESEKLEKQLGLKLKQQEMLYLDKLEEKISEELFIRMNRQMEEKVRLLREEIQRIKSKEFSAPNVTEVVDMLRSKIKSGEITNEILRTAVGKIVVFDEGDEYSNGLWGDLVPSEDREKLKNFGGIVVEYNY